MTSKVTDTPQYCNESSVRSKEKFKVTPDSKKDNKKEKNDKIKREKEETPKNFEIECSGHFNTEGTNIKRTSQNIKLEYSDKKVSGIKSNHKKEGVREKPVESFGNEGSFLKRKRNLEKKIRDDRLGYERSRSKSKEDKPFYGKNFRKFQHGHREIDMRGHRPKKGWVCCKCETINFLSRGDCFKCRRRIPYNPIYSNLPENIIHRKPSVSPLKVSRNFMPPVPFHPTRGPVFNDEYKMKSSFKDSQFDKHSSKSHFRILPRNSPIESEFSYPEISSAIIFLKKVKEAKSEDEKLKLIDSYI